MTQGNIEIKPNPIPNPIRVQLNVIIIFNKVWPDIILANNLIAKLKTLAA